MLNSCAAILAGMAAGGTGYFVGKQVSDRQDKSVKTEALVEIREDLERKQQNLSIQDKNISGEINQRLVSGAVTQEIAVYPEVRNGVVILHGRVPSAQIADRVIAAARTTPGVNRIISNLVVVNQNQQQPVPLNRAQQQQILMQQRQQQQYQQQQLQQQQMRQQRLMQQQRSQQQRSQQQQQKKNQNSANLSEDVKKNTAKNTPSRRPANNEPKKEGPDLSLIEDPPKRPANNKPKVMSEEMMQKYMGDDLDNQYINYEPRNLNPRTNYQPPLNQPVNNVPVPAIANPYIINVATPEPSFDNDSTYIPYMSKTSSPFNEVYDSTYYGNVDDAGVPVPTPAVDNANDYELYYYY
jgi:hypothetical protein